MNYLKASELINALIKHIELYGDGDVWLFDSKDAAWYSIQQSDLWIGPIRNFVINCDNDNEDD